MEQPMQNQFEYRWSRDITELPGWAKDVEKAITPHTRQMLKEYAGIPEDDLVGHIEETRKKAWDFAPFDSIGALTWLNSYLLLHEAHDAVLAKVTAGGAILDCGCMIAPDLRQLAYEGAPTENMYAFDIEPGFFEIGYSFYNDRDRFEGTFLPANGLEDLDASRLGELKGKLDVTFCAKFLHLWDRPTQIKVAAKLIALLKPQAGSMFVGSQNGLHEPQEIKVGEGRSFGTWTAYLGNAETLKEMWGEVAKLTNTKWDVQARLFDMRTIGRHDDDGSAFKKMTGYILQWTATVL